MNTQKLFLSGLVALSLAAASVQAAVLPGSDIGGIANVGGASPGDLVLGFRNPAFSDVVFDIGQYTAYEGVAPGTYTVGGFNTTELLSVFSNAFTTSGTQWTVFGGTGNGNGLSQPDSSIWATSNTALNRSSAGIQNALSSNFDQTLSASLTTSTFGGNSDANVLSSPKNFTLLSSANNYSNFFSTAVESTTVGATSLKLWELTPGSGAGTLLGTFNLDSSGLTFTVIPEPSTYAAILAVATLGFAAIRRRKQAQLLA